jgi:hypothetical protein
MNQKLDKNNKAWMLLTEDERMVLKLNLGLSKSTWKAGEIMKKSHYKLIEIKDRAKTYLRIFTIYFSKYPEIIPEKVKISPDFKTYLLGVIKYRHPISRAIQDIDSPLWKHVKSRDKIILEEMGKWAKSPQMVERDLYHLIMDFDRWNNFRILPKSIQEPSAFKRRDKNRLKKHLKVATSVPLVSFEIIQQKFGITDKRERNEAWVPLVSGSASKVEVVKIHLKDQNLREFSRCSLYVFNREELAHDYIKLVVDFINKEGKHCIDGLRFWPLYRNLIKKAVNYDQIQNVTPTRKYLNFAEPDTDENLF